MAWYDRGDVPMHTQEYPNKRKMEKGVKQAQQHGWTVTQVTPMSQGCMTQILAPFAGSRYVVVYTRAVPVSSP